jgi:hypothetical protein
MFQEKVNHFKLVKIDLNKEWIVPTLDDLVFISLVNTVVENTTLHVSTNHSIYFQLRLEGADHFRPQFFRIDAHILLSYSVEFIFNFYLIKYAVYISVDLSLVDPSTFDRQTDRDRHPHFSGRLQGNLHDWYLSLPEKSLRPREQDARWTLLWIFVDPLSRIATRVGQRLCSENL